MNTDIELRDRLTTAWSSLAALRPDVEAGEPWTLSDNFGTEPEASWGPRETLAHVQEMLPFWLGEIERVISGQAEDPIPFGRVATDDIRLAIIERDRTLPPRELFGRIETGVDRIAHRLGELEDVELDARGHHPRLGPMTVAQIIDRFVCGHLEEHVAQLREILAARG
jgi:DinB superfamily